MMWTQQLAAQLHSIASGLTSGSRAIQPPVHLTRAVKRVALQFDKGLSAAISPDRVDKAVRALMKGGVEKLKPSHRFMLSNALARSLPSLKGQSLLESQYALGLLTHWDREAHAGTFRSSHWRGLFHSYLQAPPSENTDRIRKVLRLSLPKIVQSARVRPRWMDVALRHEALLSDAPCSLYATQLLDGERTLLDELTQEISVPQGSWFWRTLAETYCRHLESLTDSDFNKRIEFSIKLAQQLLRSHRDAILTGVLNRFARSTHRPRHNLLLEFSLEAWRSPQLKTSVAWNQVRPEAKQMVCAWLAEQDLRDFYELCQGDQKVDEERLEYWLRYKHQITFTQIVLGNALRDSTDADAKEFRRRHSGRLAYLTGSSSGNNAMLMQIGNWLFVEFSETGNACFGYRMDRLPFETGAQVYAIGELKNQAIERLRGCRLIHRGNWQKDIFDPALRNRNIRPDPEGVDSQHAKPRIAASIVASIPSRLRTSIDQVGGTVSDNRPNGGCLVVRLPRFSPGIDAELRRLGFQWSRDTGYWME